MIRASLPSWETIEIAIFFFSVKSMLTLVHETKIKDSNLIIQSIILPGSFFSDRYVRKEKNFTKKSYNLTNNIILQFYFITLMTS